MLLFAALFAAFSTTVAVWINYLPFRDVATRYAPMAEALAEGDWRYAFHPRVPPLQALSGALTALICRCDGFTALKISSALWHLGSLFLVFVLFRNVYKERKMLPALAALCYAFYPYAFHMAYSGLRESAKTFLLLLIALALVKIRDNARKSGGYILLGIGCGLSAVHRQEMIPLALCCIFFGAVEESLDGKFPRRIFIPAVMTMAFLAVNTMINRHFFQIAMPDCSFEQLYQKLSGGGKPGVAVFYLSALALAVFIPAAGFTAAKLLRKVPWQYFFCGALALTAATTLWALKRDPAAEIWEFLDSVSKGFYRFAGAFAFLSIIYLAWRKRLSRSDLWVLATAFSAAILSIVLTHLFYGKLFVPSRYLFPGMPLLFGVLLLGIEELFSLVSRFIGKFPAQILSILLIGGAVYGLTTHMSQPLRRQLGRKRNIAMRKMMDDLSEILKKDYSGPAVREVNFYSLIYNSRRCPKVFFADDDKVCVVSYFAGGSPALYYPEADYYIGIEPLPKGRSGVKIGEVKTYELTLSVWRMKK